MPSLTQVYSATSTGATIAVPADVLAGDLLVLLDRADSTSSTVPTLVTPTGFTSIGDVSLTNLWVRQNLSYKVAAVGDASATVTGMNGSAYNNKSMYVFRVADRLIESVTASNVNGVCINEDPSAQTVSASSRTAPLVVLGAYSVLHGAYSVDPRTFNPEKDGEIFSSTFCYLAYKIYNASPADVTIDMGDEGVENALQSCCLEVHLVPLTVAADAGAFTFTGQAATFTVGTPMGAATGVFVLAGQEVEFSIFPPRATSMETPYDHLPIPSGRRVFDPKTGMASGDWDKYLRRLNAGWNDMQQTIVRSS